MYFSLTNQILQFGYRYLVGASNFNYTSLIVVINASPCINIVELGEYSTGDPSIYAKHRTEV